MSMSTVINDSVAFLDNASDTKDTEQSEQSEITRTMRIDTKPLQIPDVLDPDDILMKKFQDALRDHLNRVDHKLTSEISELEAEIKGIEKEHEAEALRLYYAQQEIAQQQMTIEKYQNMIENVVSLHEEKNTHVKDAKQLHKAAQEKLLVEKKKEEKLLRDSEQLATLQAKFAEWQTELENSLVISKQVSKKDRIIQRDLIAQKQQKDFIIFKLMEEVWRIKTEISNLDTQLQIKNKEKIEISQMIADVNADLEALHRQHVNLCSAWNSVVQNIAKRNKVYEQLNAEREEIRESFRTLHLEIEKLKKETHKETENNENLTLLHMRVEDNIQINSKLIATENDKLSNLQSELVKITKFYDQEKNEYDLIHNEWQYLLSEAEEIHNELVKCLNMQSELENTIYSKLEEKIAHDKTARYLNKLLLDSKKSLQEQELSLVEFENLYGKKLFELEGLNACIAHEKTELEELLQNNLTKEKEIDELQKEIGKHDTAIERKRIKLMNLSKTIEEILAHTGGEEINPLDMKIITLEKNIQEAQQNNQKTQQFWIRQEGHMITLSQQRDLQLQELNLLNKEIMIMEQKNLKIEYAMEMLNKENAKMDRVLNSLQQKLMQINAQLVIQKELKEELEDKNSITRNEGIKSLKEAELHLIKLENDLKQLHEEKALLKDNLDAAQQESLSWEKKVQLIQQTMKNLKDERNDGGDIAVMKTEIHKMEMRLSYLHRAQEKLIHDMEFCVARRDVILDKVMSKFKKDPKGEHNQKVIFCKRLADQELKIKQIVKDTKQTEYKILTLETQVKDALEKSNESTASLKIIEDVIPNLDQKITETEAIKYQNLQSLVFKQRKAKLLQDIKSGRYKMLYKSEAALNEEFQNEKILHDYLKHIMEQTYQDFPLLRNNIQKILLTLEIL